MAAMVPVQVESLMKHGGVPRPLGLAKPVSAAAVAGGLGLKLIGPDRLISKLSHERLKGFTLEGALVFVEDGQPVAAESNEVIFLLSQESAGDVDRGATVLIVPEDADRYETFRTVCAYLAAEGGTEMIAGSVHKSARISEFASIDEHVHVGANAYVGPFSRIGPNTVIGDNVYIKPNTTIGCVGARTASDMRTVSEWGGVWLGEFAEIGASVSIFKGYLGGFTAIGRETKIDNLVFIGAGAQLGRDCSLVAGSVLGKNVELGEGVWLGPNVNVADNVFLDRYCYVGSGASVSTDLPALMWATGRPARPFGIVCRCKKKLIASEGKATCNRCGRSYHLSGSTVIED
jgi:UDP-3-O-[3-hydroxymyristoyl] glucosamine N-acyltransferase